ncbi:MAG TPA: Gar1/Naf1 family protein [candidate division Zixibacteria bacterium]|nr:Gar1/Naf1 family protein [candidate division Zixibacteria bacterium]
MQRLGLILHVTPSRNVIAKIENVPRIGETVVDENLKPVGKVFDILGPVSSPYATIVPTIRDPEKLSNKTVYVLPSKRRKEKNRYGR